MLHQVKSLLPEKWVPYFRKKLFQYRRAKIRTVHNSFAMLGYNVSDRSDYYSTLPVLSDLARHTDRWFKPSELAGVQYDLPAMKEWFSSLHKTWGSEFEALTGDYKANVRRGFGPGYPYFDARLLYYLIRELKPRRYLEIGSGLSTYYCTLAAEQNAQQGKPLEITCIEPYPSDLLRGMSNIKLIVDVCQNVPVDQFRQLEDGDVLFIDSSHALKIDSDVAYLFLEVLPNIKPGVWVHIHDVPFPYNIPFPPSTWILGERKPVYWNEAMVVQTFLAYNDSFRMELCTPLIRHFDEALFTSSVPAYVPLKDDPNPFSSLWIRRIK